MISKTDDKLQAEISELVTGRINEDFSNADEVFLTAIDTMAELAEEYAEYKRNPHAKEEG